MLMKGHKVEAKPARPVTVYNLTLQEFTPPLFTLGERALHIHVAACLKLRHFLLFLFHRINGFLFVCFLFL